MNQTDKEDRRIKSKGQSFHIRVTPARSKLILSRDVSYGGLDANILHLEVPAGTSAANRAEEDKVLPEEVGVTC